MAQIEVKFDHSLEQSAIVLPLNTPDGSDEQGKDGTSGTQTPIKQTAMYGVRVPLIRIGDLVIDFNDIIYMVLDGSGRRPTLHLEITDSAGKIRGLQNPGPDNEVRLQILPRFENAYKKIDLTFYIQDRRDDGNLLIFDCIYKLPALYSSRIKCFGEVSTYEMFETIAHDCQLGFASNVENGDDLRYLYCANDSYNSLMENAIWTSGQAGNDISSKVMYDYWIDFWNNINFVDVYERYNTVEPDENIQVWIGDVEISADQTSNDDQAFVQTTAVLSNDPSKYGTELFVGNYNTINNSTQATKGSDRVLSIYNINDGESLDFLLSDGDQQQDVFTKYEYIGECYSNFNYLLAGKCREMMLDKIRQQIIEVKLDSPTIGLMRGGKVNLTWYDTDAKLLDLKDNMGIKNSDIESNIPLPDGGDEHRPGPRYSINKTVSGQYYILSSVIKFENNLWSNTLQLVRPREGVMNPLELDHEEYKKIKR